MHSLGFLDAEATPFVCQNQGLPRSAIFLYNLFNNVKFFPIMLKARLIVLYLLCTTVVYSSSHRDTSPSLKHTRESALSPPEGKVLQSIGRKIQYRTEADYTNYFQKYVIQSWLPPADENKGEINRLIYQILTEEPKSGDIEDHLELLKTLREKRERTLAKKKKHK